MSETKGIFKKLYEIQKMGLKYKKEAENPFYKSKYLSLDALLEKLLPIAEEKNLLISHYGRDGYLITQVTDLDSDTYVDSALPLPEGVDAQKLGGAVTYFKRYNLGSLFNIVTDEDDDANGTISKDNDDF